MKKVKKLLSLALAFLMVMNLGLPARAAEEFTLALEADKTSLRVGDIVTVTVTAANSPNLDGVEFTVKADNTVFELVKTEPSTSFNVKDQFADKGTIAFDRLEMNSSFLMPETVASIQFKALKDAESAAISLEGVSAYSIDASYNVNDVAVTVSDPISVVVSSIEPGYTGDTYCDDCGELIAKGEVIPALGHNYEDGVCSKTSYNAYYLTVQYDKEKLSYTGTDASITDDGNGTLTIAGYGADRSFTEGSINLSFEAKGTDSSEVTISAAKIDEKENAIQDAPDASIVDGVVAVTVSGYTVGLPGEFEGESVVAPDMDYIFTAKDLNYNYTVTAKVDGSDEALTITGSGTKDDPYKISKEQITGNLTITTDKEGKLFAVTLGDDMTADKSGKDAAQYMKDYTAKLTKASGSTYTVTATRGGEAYTGFTYNEETGIITVPGKDITGDLVFNSGKVAVTPDEYTVSFDGNASAEAAGAAKVVAGEDYSFTLNKTEGYTYTVTYKMGDGESVELTEAEGKYTIGKVSGNLVITVSKTLSLTVKVNEYVKYEDGRSLFRVEATGTLPAGKSYAYDNNAMYYVEGDEGQVWYWLVEVGAGETLTDADAKAEISLTEAAGTRLEETMDVNGTDKVDINDAQFVYNIYNIGYDSIDDIGMAKYLLANTNGDTVVDSQDAAAVVSAILKAKP